MDGTIDFKDELTAKLEQFEKYRQSMNRKFIAHKTISKVFKFVYYPGLVAAIATAILPFLLPFTLIFIVISGALFILDIVLYQYVFKAPDIRFRKKFKEDVVRWLMKKLNPSFVYDPEGKVPVEDIQRADVFKSSIDSYDGEDYVKGTVEGVEVQFGEATLYVDKETFGSVAGDIAEGILDIFTGADDTADNADTANYVKFFNGLVMSANFGKQEAGTVLAIPNKVVGTGLFRKNTFQGKKRFETGNSEFDQLFSCYSTNNVEPHSILNSEVQEAIMELVRTVRVRVYFSFAGGTVFLGIDWNKDLFEADLKQGISTIKDIEFVIEQIRFFEYLVKRLAVDTQIWVN